MNYFEMSTPGSKLLVVLAAILALTGCNGSSSSPGGPPGAPPGGGPPPGPVADDTISITNDAGAEVGLLIDGTRLGFGVVNDDVVLTSAPVVSVGQLHSASPGSNEVIGFTRERPPQRVDAPWSTGTDAVAVNFAARIGIGVTVWIVHGPFAQQRDHAIDARIITEAIWDVERMGVHFSHYQILDATADPEAPDNYAFPNGDLNPAAWTKLRNDIGFVNDQLNIYWVDTVDGNTTNGWSNFGAQVAMGRNSGDELLVHEVGHAFGLEHINTVPGFDDTNIMFPFSNSREFATEGQVFRAHLDPGSVINSVYNSRPGEIQRACPMATAASATASCLAIAKRMWADGTFPPN